MAKVKIWIKALRLRTLPLSLSGILLGSFIAKFNGFWNTTIFVFALLTTVLFQIVSNLANDLGDSQKGTDNENRIGPVRAVQSGEIGFKAMKNAVILTSILAFLAAIYLIYVGSQDLSTELKYFYLFLALSCILAAITYTVGKKAYGYHGFGDVFVFIFFGFVSVLGVYTLFAKEFEVLNILPAITIGCLSTAVLNLNNMRDRINDAASNKKTLVVILGLKNAKRYHYTLILFSFISLTSFIFFLQKPILYLSILPYFILFMHLLKVKNTKIEKEFDPELKKVALTTFLISILFIFGVIL